MKEIGGYLELDTYNMPMMHGDAMAFNSGRSCLAYLIEKKNIKKMRLPKFLCACVGDICEQYDVEVNYYQIGKDFLPREESIGLVSDEWIYMVNYFGQMDNSTLKRLKAKYKNIIVDNIQAYFQKPNDCIDTIYTCRKFFGVADGAFLYSDVEYDVLLERDYSCERMKHLLGRYEKSASDFYSDYVKEEEQFEHAPIKRMSKLTNNLLHGIDYKYVEKKRRENYMYLHQKLRQINELELKIPVGPYMYPFYIKNGEKIRKKLKEKKIFIPILWPDVLELCDEEELEYIMAKNILPLPIDQRYCIEDMEYMVKEILNVV